eukprot:scaffold22994_cov63-Phaeocystis_antarctica.AAC.7
MTTSIIALSTRACSCKPLAVSCGGLCSRLRHAETQPAAGAPPGPGRGGGPSRQNDEFLLQRR